MNETNMSVTLAQKNAAMESERIKARPVSEAIDATGKVKVFHLENRKWIKVWPIDAMELINSGQAAMTKPFEDTVQPDQEDDTAEDTVQSDQEEAIESKKVPELRQYAKLHKIDISGLTKRADIIETIREAEKQEDDENGEDEDQE